MRCLKPLRLYSAKSGTGKTQNIDNGDPESGIWVACGYCTRCRQKLAIDWQTRLCHEVAMAYKSDQDSIFVTWTFDDDHLPRLHPDDPFGNADYRILQRAIRNVRRELLREHGETFRVYNRMEYGSRSGRAHGHSLIMGGSWYRHLQPTGYTGRAGHELKTSDLLSRHWPYGSVLVGEANAETAAYVSRYVGKGDRPNPVRKADYETLDPRTGEVLEYSRPVSRMSLKPGIGEPFVRRYAAQLAAHDGTIINGHFRTLPKYYEDQLRLLGYSDQVDANKLRRRDHAESEPLLSPKRRADLALFDQVMEQRAERDPW